MLGLDSWVFDVGAVFVAHTGAVSMDVHQILFSISRYVINYVLLYKYFN